MTVMRFVRPKVVEALAALLEYVSACPTACSNSCADLLDLSHTHTCRLLDELAYRADLAGPPRPEQHKPSRPPGRPFNTPHQLARLTEVNDYLARYPGASAREVARALNVSHTTAGRYVNEINRRPAPPAPAPRVQRPAATWIGALL